MIKAKRFYICNQTRCGDRCSASRGECTHTTDIAFAKFRSPNYECKWTYSEGNEPLLWEITQDEYREVMDRVRGEAYAGVESKQTQP